MRDLLIGVGLVLVIEGVLWAAFPHLAVRFLQAASVTPEGSLRAAGAVAVALGVALVWLVRE